MPLVTKGPFYVDSYDVGADDYGDSPYADVIIGHPDGFRIVVSIKKPFLHKDKVSIHVEWP